MRKRLKTLADLVSSHNEDASIALFAVAGFVGLAQALRLGIDWGRGFEMIQIARSLAHHGSFANPFGAADTGYTAANPPAYPFLLALIMKLIPSETYSALVATLGSILMNAATAALLPYVSMLFFEEALSGIAAAILWIIAVQPIPSWDTSYTVAGLLLFTLVTASHSIRRERLIPNAIMGGGVAGIIFLLNPSAILIFIPWLIFLCASRTSLHRTAITYSTILLLTCALFPICWGFRNYHQLGGFVIRTNLGMTLYSSNNDCAQPSLMQNAADNCYQSHHPNTSVQEAAFLRDVGEVKYDRIRIADAKQWIEEHPSAFTRLAAARFRQFWFPRREAGNSVHALAISSITLLSLPGLLLLIRRRVQVVFYMFSVLMLYPLLYYIVVTDIRYRYPVLWLSLLPAGYFISELLGASHNPSSGEGLSPNSARIHQS